MSGCFEAVPSIKRACVCRSEPGSTLWRVHLGDSAAKGVCSVPPSSDYSVLIKVELYAVEKRVLKSEVKAFRPLQPFLGNNMHQRRGSLPLGVFA
jgi:hypothetical protein